MSSLDSHCSPENVWAARAHLSHSGPLWKANAVSNRWFVVHCHCRIDCEQICKKQFYPIQSAMTGANWKQYLCCPCLPHKTTFQDRLTCPGRRVGLVCLQDRTVFPEIRYPCVLAVEAGTLLRWEWHGMAPINSDRWGAGANGPTRSHFGRSSRRNREAAWLVTASTHFIRSPKYETEVAIFDGLVGGKTWRELYSTMNYGVSCTFYLKHPETNSWTFAGGRNPLEHGFYLPRRWFLGKIWFASCLVNWT